MSFAGRVGLSDGGVAGPGIQKPAFHWPAGDLATAPSPAPKPWSWPAGQLALAPNPAPAYQAPYQAPYQPPAQNNFVGNNTPSYGVGTPDSGGYGGTPQPEPQPKPVMSEGDWLAGDGEYQNQMTEYDNTLKDFLSRLATQKSDFQTDYNTANRGMAQNKERGMQNLGEDFTSRGLANSGLFNHSRDESLANYKQQQDGLDSAKTRAFSDFSQQGTDKQKATDQAKGNAKRSSLGRMSMAQQF